MKELINTLRNWLRGAPAQSEPSITQHLQIDQAAGAAQIDQAAAQRLLHILEQTQEGQYTCAETFELLDEYVDLVVDRRDAEALMPYVKRHLDHCPNCRAHYEMLLQMLQDA